jgi:hypothetical protein
MKTYAQLAIVALTACLATWTFDVSGQYSLLTLILIIPVFLGEVAGLIFSGHGSNQTVGLIAAMITNSVVWIAVWLTLRSLFRLLRKQLPH